MILKDPRVLSALPLKKRGEKGWRELQGDALRDLLLELIRKEVSVLCFHYIAAWETRLCARDSENNAKSFFFPTAGH